MKNFDKEKGRESHLQLVESFFKIIKGMPLFLECGARAAETSIRFKKENPSSRVMAFEANPFTYQRLTRNAVEHGVEVYNLGLSDTCGTFNFRVPEKDVTLGSASFMPRVKEIKHTLHPVQVITIDSLNLDASPIVMWIDVEGLAYEVLTGADKTLDNTSVVFVEVEEEQKWKNQKLVGDVHKLLINKDFSFYQKDQEYATQHNRIYIK